MTAQQNKFKIAVATLFALAILLGLATRTQMPDFSFGSNTKVTHFSAPKEKSLTDFYTQNLKIAKQNKPTGKVSFLAVGDIMLSRKVALAIQNNTSSADFPFQNFASTLNSTDFNFGNLESPFGSSTIVGGESLVFGAPTSTAQLLAKYFGVLNLANNHAFDQGKNGLLFTKSYLESLGILTIGTGENLGEAWKPTIVEKNGVKICFIGASYSSVNDSGKIKNDFVARTDDLENLKSSILNLKSSCDFIVVTMHAGTEYTRKPNKTQTTFAHTAIDLGADIVIGAHPHWVQTIERYCPNSTSTVVAIPVKTQKATYTPASLTCASPKYIFYSLGNFIFDQDWSQETKEGLALKLQITNFKSQMPGASNAATLNDLQNQGQNQKAKLDSIELIPLVIENYSTPRPATASETLDILEKIGEKEQILY